jgi:hypothetical protein
MSRLIWKELREHYQLALLVMLGLLGAELAALYQIYSDQADTNYYRGITLTRDDFLLVTTFGSAAVGLLFGFLQILPELKPDRWAALLHRPAPRGRIFLGKAIGGTLLYCLATVPPFLVCTWLAATPGHFAVPFVPEFTLAGIADTITGLVYYLAALLIALQRGGGFGLRALPLLAAVHVTTFVGRTMWFHDAVAAVALMILALGFAASGAMVNRDSFGARPWPARLGLLIVVFYGLCGIVDLVEGTYNGRSYSPPPSSFSYELSEEGRPLKLNFRKDMVVSVEELDGSTPTSANYKPDRVRNHTPYLNSACSYIGDSHGLNLGWRPNRYRMTMSYLTASPPISDPEPEQWFQLVKEPSFVGMSLRSRMPVARLDEHGFQPVNTPPTPFPRDVTIQPYGGLDYTLWSPTRLRFADFRRRKIIEVPLPSPGPIYGVTTASAQTDSGRAGATVVALRTAMAFYDGRDERLVALVPYHRDTDRWGQINVGISPGLDRFYLWYHPSVWLPYEEQLTMPSYVDETDAQGNVLHTYTVPPAPRTRYFPTPITSLVSRGQSPAFFFGTMLYERFGGMTQITAFRKRHPAYFGGSASDAKRTAIIVVLGSLLCAGVTLYWARRAQFDWPSAWRWAGLALAFNIAGLIMFRLVADWPRLVACAACQRRRPIHLARCPHCAQGWPSVEPTGAEIFDESDISQQEPVGTVAE